MKSALHGLLLILLLSLGRVADAQYQSFSIPQNVSMLGNPALMGSDTAITVGVSSYFLKLRFPYSTTTRYNTGFIHSYVPLLNSYIGVSYSDDRVAEYAPINNYSVANFYYNQNINLSKVVLLRAGIRVGVFNKRATGNIQSGDVVDPYTSLHLTPGASLQPIQGVDVCLGGTMHWKGLTLAYSSDHVNQANVSLIDDEEHKLRGLNTFSASFNLPLEEEVRNSNLQPYFRYSQLRYIEKLGKATPFKEIGMNISVSGVTVGGNLAYYDVNSYVIYTVVAGYQNKRFSAFVSYAQPRKIQFSKTLSLQGTIAYKILRTSSSSKFAKVSGPFF